MFVVQEGLVVVEEGVLDNQEILVGRRLLLEVGGSHIVGAGVIHQFRVLESGKMTEVYFPSAGGLVRQDDIERLIQGGSDNPDVLRAQLEDMGVL
jgi:hypothetical protein